MLHPTLQSQINEFLNKNADPEKITMLFRKISETYHEYDEKLKEASAIELAKGIKMQEEVSA